MFQCDILQHTIGLDMPAGSQLVMRFASTRFDVTDVIANEISKLRQK